MSVLDELNRREAAKRAGHSIITLDNPDDRFAPDEEGVWWPIEAGMVVVTTDAETGEQKTRRVVSFDEARGEITVEPCE